MISTFFTEIYTRNNFSSSRSSTLKLRQFYNSYTRSTYDYSVGDKFLPESTWPSRPGRRKLSISLYIKILEIMDVRCCESEPCRIVPRVYLTTRSDVCLCFRWNFLCSVGFSTELLLFDICISSVIVRSWYKGWCGRFLRWKTKGY